MKPQGSVTGRELLDKELLASQGFYFMYIMVTKSVICKYKNFHFNKNYYNEMFEKYSKSFTDQLSVDHVLGMSHGSSFMSLHTKRT
jgi:hypothetical protein